MLHASASHQSDSDQLAQVDAMHATGMPLALSDLAAHWAKAGAALPVAVAVSIFDDLLSSYDAQDHPTRPRPLRLQDILLDANGQAHLLFPGGLSQFEFCRLLREILSGGFGDSGIPPAAHALLSQVGSVQSWEAVLDPEMLRARLRSCLGVPAAHHEVGAFVTDHIDRPSGPVEVATAELKPPSADFLWAQEQVNTVEVKAAAPEVVAPVDQVHVEEEATEDLELVLRNEANESEEADCSEAPDQAEVSAELICASALIEDSEDQQHDKEEALEVPELDDEQDHIGLSSASDSICVTNHPTPDYYEASVEQEEDKPPSLLPRVRQGLFSRPTFQKVTRPTAGTESQSQIPRVRLLPSRRRPLTLPVAPPARLRQTTTGPADSMISLPRKAGPALWVGLICVCAVVGALAYSMMAF